MTRFVCLTAAIIVAAGLTVLAGPIPKVTICHIPPGNPATAHTITVGEPAVPAHLAHHSGTLGPCRPNPSVFK